MVATQSNMVPLGTKAHPFSLMDSVNQKINYFSFETQGKGFLIAFICNHCPYVVHLNKHFPTFFNSLKELEIKVYAISSNDAVAYPDDSPEKMAIEAKRLQFNFPYLYDETQSVAKLYNAACTPDFFLYNKDKELFYRGQYDGTRPGKKEEVNGFDLTNAVDLLLAEKNPPNDQVPSLGCNIKWK